MAETITPTTKHGLERLSNADWVQDKADAAIDQINADIAILDGTPSNAQVIQIVRRILVRQRQEIKYLAAQVT